MRLIFRILTIFTLILFLGSCTDRGATILERVKQDGYLRVITRNSPTTYYHGPQGEMGLEYELVARFARSLGVRVKFIVPENYSDIYKKVSKGRAHFAAAGLPVSDKYRRLIR